MTTKKKTEETLQVPRRVKGTLVAEGGDRYSFQPQGEGAPLHTEVRRAGDAKLYRTTSEKKPRLVAHLSVPADDADPAQQMAAQLDQLTTALPQPLPLKTRGRYLLNQDDAKVRHDAAQQTLFVQLSIDYQRYRDITNRLLTLMQQVSQCFVINQTSLVPRRK